MSNNQTYHPFVYTFKDLLDKREIDYLFYEHKEVKTSQEAAEVRAEYSLSQGVKALILKIYEKNNPKFIQVAIPGDKRLSSKKLRTLLNISNLTFATEIELSKITNGIVSGGVPPLGNFFDIEVFLDKKVIENENIIFNCGDRKASISITSKDYLEIVSPTICDIVE